MPSYREILNGILRECRAYEQRNHHLYTADVSDRIEDIWQTIFGFGSFRMIDNEIEVDMSDRQKGPLKRYIVAGTYQNRVYPVKYRGIL